MQKATIIIQSLDEKGNQSDLKDFVKSYADLAR